MLSEKEKEYFEKLLTQKLDENLGKARYTLNDIKNFDDRLSDVIDEAYFASEMGFTLHIRNREAKLIKKIKDALARLEEGTFGICERCRSPIPLERLRARPVTTLCINCKKKEEAAEKTRMKRHA